MVRERSCEEVGRYQGVEVLFAAAAAVEAEAAAVVVVVKLQKCLQARARAPAAESPTMAPRAAQNP
jgi:hypothetical protein